MSRRAILTVFRRELRDVLRDRRTLFTMLVLPVVLYPALMLGFTQLTISRSRELLRQDFPVMIEVGGEALTRSATPREGSLERFLLDVAQFRLVNVRQPEQRVERGEIALYVDLPGDLASRVDGGEAVEIVPVYRSSDDVSSAAKRLFREAVDDFRQSRWPLELNEIAGDRSTPEQRGGHTLGGLLAMMVVIMAMTGAFYPALDVAAGEKERGTLETLLLSPVARQDLVTGKYLTVFAVALTAATMNLGSLVLTFTGFSSILSGARGGEIEFSIPPQAIAVIFAGLALMAGLFSAVCLALSTFARTYKEGQAYMTPALIVVMPLSMVAMLPNLRLDAGTALVPVANLALLMKELLIGRFPAQEILLVLGVLLLLALAALHWTVGLFGREEVLFREGRQVFGLRPPPGVPRPARPGAGAALLGMLLGITVLYHLGTRLAGAGTLVTLVATQAALAVVALLMAGLTMAPLGSGLALRLPGLRATLGGILLGVGGAVLSAGIAALQVKVLGSPGESVRELERAFEEILSLSLPVAVLLVGLVPAIGEELLFRGLVLQGFRGALGDRGAVIASAIAFGLFHLDLHRFFPQAVLGLFLGAIALRSRSIVPAILAHALHNATVIVAAETFDLEGLEAGLPLWTLPPALLVAGLALGLAGARKPAA